ncbi:MAG: hypothetical protein JWO18_577 [Microbacteriaceae bacterium]|nr:hypothetical protein [Microbacteriaceae bacterium]
MSEIVVPVGVDVRSEPALVSLWGTLAPIAWLAIVAGYAWVTGENRAPDIQGIGYLLAFGSFFVIPCIWCAVLATAIAALVSQNRSRRWLEWLAISIVLIEIIIAVVWFRSLRGD